jgi:hypothetical protein
MALRGEVVYLIGFELFNHIPQTVIVAHIRVRHAERRIRVQIIVLLKELIDTLCVRVACPASNAADGVPLVEPSWPTTPVMSARLAMAAFRTNKRVHHFCCFKIFHRREYILRK